MKSKELKFLKEFYVEVELGLFNNKTSFKDFLKSLSKECYEEIISTEKYFTLTYEKLQQFVNLFDIEEIQNKTNKNILVKHISNNALDIEILIYSLHDRQSYSRFGTIPSRYINKNSKILKDTVYAQELNGVYEMFNNYRVFVYFND